MTPEPNETLDDELVRQLADYDDLLVGKSVPDNDKSETTLEPEARRLRSCIRLLRRANAAPLPPISTWSGTSPEAFGRFRIRAELGRGGFGIVYLADDPILNRPVALKVPRVEVLASTELRERFLREARAAAGLDHPNVVSVYEAGEVGQVCYIASVYCPGPNLAVWLREQKQYLQVETIARLMICLAEAVQHAHARGVLHRDLKPSNVLLVPRPETEISGIGDLAFVPRLTDFGLARLLEAEVEQTTSGAVLGTPAYMAPEQAEGWSHRVGAATDIYALGVMLYELLTRRLPHAGPSLLVTLEQIRSGQPTPPRQLRPEIPPDLETICLRCLVKEPEHRYASAAELGEDLQRFLRGEPIRARRPGFLSRLRSWSRRPERLRDARLMATINAFFIFSGTLFMYSLLMAGVFTVADFWIVTLMVGTMNLISTVPNVLIALKTDFRHPAALWAGILCPWTYPIVGVPVALDMLPNGGLSNTQDPAMGLGFVVLIAHLDAIECVAYLFALNAYAWNRRTSVAPTAAPLDSGRDGNRH